MISLLIAIIVMASTTAAVKDVFALVGAIAAGLAGLAYIARRIMKAVKLLELIVDLKDTLDDISKRMQGLEEADEAQANDHNEVKGLLAALDEKVQGVAALGEENHERLQALSRDLGVAHRDAA